MQKYFQKLIKIKFDNRGNILLFASVFGFISFSLIVVGVSGYAISENRASNSKHNRELAFQVAEAGINYYQWHLAHNKTDYKDGTGLSGPYVHDYEDKDGNVIGHFSLNITSPPVGSSVVLIESTGWIDAQPNSTRIIKARIGFPSLTDYAFLVNTDLWVGDNEVIHGKLHANGGIRFDGIGDAPITSATPTYICKAHHGCGNQEKPGVWGQGGPEDLWDFPVPWQDFEAVTAKLSEVEDNSAPALGGLNFSSSGKQGWRLEFLANGTIKAYKVNSTYCYSGKDIGSNKFVSYCVDIKTLGSPTTYNMPTNGNIFVNDNVWVDGVVNGRATIGTVTGKSIIINGNITYLAKDGNHVLGLMAEKDVIVPHNSPDVLEIDAAMLAQHGSAKRYYYSGDMKTSITTYGAVISAGIPTWSWVSGGGSVTSGYRTTNSTYDANLTYGPPPAFPVGSSYHLISWELIK
ncbi:MAG: hypothetical protein Q7S66_04315 [bacterium]|nr:hypothetical protein [bacterium]